MLTKYHEIENMITKTIIESPSNALAHFRQTVLEFSLIVYVFTSFIAVSFSLLRVVDIGFLPIMILHITEVVLIAFIATLRKRIPYKIAASCLPVILFINAFLSLCNFGMSSQYAAYFTLSILMSFLFYGVKVGVSVGILSLLFIFTAGFFVSVNLVTFNIDFNAYNNSFYTWLSSFTAYFFIVLVTVVCIGWIYKMLEISLAQLKVREIELLESRNQLKKLANIDELTQLPNRRYFTFLAEKGYCQLIEFRR